MLQIQHGYAMTLEGEMKLPKHMDEMQKKDMLEKLDITI